MIDGDEGYGRWRSRRVWGLCECETSVPLFEVRVSFSGCTPGRLGEDAAKPAIPFADMRAFSLASTFVVTRADARPGSQVIGSGKLGHIRTNFRNQDSCCFAPNSWDCLK